MKNRILAVLTLIGAITNLWADEGFTTTFKIAGLADTTNFIIRIHDGPQGFGEFRFDTIQVVKGYGVLADVCGVDYPVSAFAFTPYGAFSFYVANNVDEEISGSVADIENVSLTYKDAPWSDDLMVYNREIDAPLENLNRKQANMPNLTKEGRDSIYAGYKALSQKEKKMYVKYPNSWVTLHKMMYDMADMPREDLEGIYANLTPDRKASKYGLILKNYLSVTPIAEGAAMADYDIEGTDQNGNHFRLSDMKEPYILVDFSASTCGPCIMAAKEIAKLKEIYADQVGFVNYSCDDTEAEWREAVNRDSITWTSVFDGSGPMGSVCLKYNVNSYPTFVVYGPNRTVIKYWSGYGPGLIERELSEFISRRETED